ncbi:hypothetical protein ACFL0B_06490 [Thermodesulfobacteriota bacterium]
MREELKVLFITRFSESDAKKNLYASAAADLVQMQIIRDSEKILGVKNIYYLNMEPQRFWPYGKLWMRSKVSQSGYTPAYINLAVLRSIIFSIHVCYFIIKKRPKVVLAYNSYFFDAIAFVFTRFFICLSVVAIVQDVRTGKAFNCFARLHDYFSCLLIRYFNFVIPVSEKLAQYIRVKDGLYKVFPGAPTLPSLACTSDVVGGGGAVFAGALEAYNGVDRLITTWVEQDIQTTLHIFGRGSLVNLVKKSSEASNKIVYHGFLSPEEVYEWQATAKFNICLRYPEGLDEEFFFPSKFFNSCCFPGLLVVNNFKGIPEVMLSSPGLFCDDLLGLKKLDFFSSDDIHAAHLEIKERISRDYSWEMILSETYSKFNLNSNI